MQGGTAIANDIPFSAYSAYGTKYKMNEKPGGIS